MLKLIVTLVTVTTLLVYMASENEAKKIRRVHGPRGMGRNQSTSCSEFSKHGRFNPYSVINEMWFVFFYWAAHRPTEIYRFYPVTVTNTEYLHKVLDGKVDLPVNWTARQVLMRDLRNATWLLVERGDRGQYWSYMIAKVRKQNKIRAQDVRLRQHDNGRLLGFMECKSEFLYIMSRINEVPPQNRIQEEAAAFGFRARRGKSYLYQGHEWMPIPEADENDVYPRILSEFGYFTTDEQNLSINDKSGEVQETCNFKKDSSKQKPVDLFSETDVNLKSELDAEPISLVSGQEPTNELKDSGSVNDLIDQKPSTLMQRNLTMLQESKPFNNMTDNVSVSDTKEILSVVNLKEKDYKLDTMNEFKNITTNNENELDFNGNRAYQNTDIKIQPSLMVPKEQEKLNKITTGDEYKYDTQESQATKEFKQHTKPEIEKVSNKDKKEKGLIDESINQKPDVKMQPNFTILQEPDQTNKITDNEIVNGPIKSHMKELKEIFNKPLDLNDVSNNEHQGLVSTSDVTKQKASVKEQNLQSITHGVGEELPNIWNNVNSASYTAYLENVENQKVIEQGSERNKKIKFNNPIPADENLPPKCYKMEMVHESYEFSPALIPTKLANALDEMEKIENS